ncbi:MAG: FecR domain-containing protein [Bacteroidales bacterium]|nr:FecR domain-containing protein [Bacteroidales bacterium]
MNIDQDLFFKFFSREASVEETDALTAWLDEDPSHQEEFNKAYEMFMISHVVAFADLDRRPAAEHKPAKKHRWLAYVASAAASVIIGMVINSYFFTRPILEVVDSTVLVSEAQPGQRTSVTLSDGTVVELNSNSRIEYPAIFHKGERKVRLEGEAMFDVAPDREHPFVVETFAYDVKVLGTKFDVIADSREREFSTALLEGSVSIQDKSAKPLVTLRPNMMASMHDGRLVCSRLSDKDAYLWTDGVISAVGIPFDKLMRRFERCYGVNIDIASASLPEVRYVYFKVRISDGIDHALRLLQDGSDFNYRYEEETNTYIIY